MYFLVVINVVVRYECVFALKSTTSRNLPLGFLCAKGGLAYSLKGNVVIMCSRASSTRI